MSELWIIRELLAEQCEDIPPQTKRSQAREIAPDSVWLWCCVYRTGLTMTSISVISPARTRIATTAV